MPATVLSFPHGEIIVPCGQCPTCRDRDQPFAEWLALAWNVPAVFALGGMLCFYGAVIGIGLWLAPW